MSQNSFLIQLWCKLHPSVEPEESSSLIHKVPDVDWLQRLSSNDYSERKKNNAVVFFSQINTVLLELYFSSV